MHAPMTEAAQPSTSTRPFLCGDALEVNASGRATLIGGRCADCGTETFPRVPVCASCMSENIRPQPMPHEGTLYAFSVVHAAAKKWRKPMRIGYVDLKNGARVFTHLEGADLAIGDDVEVDVGTVGDDEEGPIASFVFRKVKR
jgi:benzoylsuccinyl-CoA thiolase BbsA subunit